MGVLARCSWVAAGFLSVIQLVDGSYARFNEAFTSSMLSKVATSVAIPWKPLGSIATAFSSYEEKLSDTTSVDGNIVMDDNATAALIWALFKPYAETETNPIDALYAGFENAKIVMYERSPEYRKRPVTFLYTRDSNFTCYKNNVEYSGCFVRWNNATNQETGAREGGSTYTEPDFDCRKRPWYIDSKANSEAKAGAVGAMWTDPYVFVQSGTIGLTASRHLVTKDGIFVGVVGADFELSTLKSLLQDSASSSGGTLIAFVVDADGKIISSSESDTTLSADGTTQLLATNSSNRVISSVAREVDKRGGWAKTSGEVVTTDVASLGLYWFQHLNLTDQYGLRWHVVVAEVVQCDRGYFVSMTVPETGTGKECLPCPEGAICNGGTAMPFPKAGWWINRASYAAGNTAFRCVRATCLGFQARADPWAKSVYASGGNFEFGGFSEIDEAAYDFDDDVITADDDYVGLTGASLEPLACWYRAAFVNASSAAYAHDSQPPQILDLPQCTDYELMCAPGSVGPLCGSCFEGFAFSSSARLCLSCEHAQTFLPLLVLGLFLLAIAILRLAHLKSTERSWHATMCRRLLGSGSGAELKNPFRHLDRGMLKVAWATLQILSTVSWNLAVQFPEPFSGALELLSFMSLDFSAALTCTSKLELMPRTLSAALAPLIVILVNFVLYYVRRARLKSTTQAVATPNSNEHSLRQGPSRRSSFIPHFGSNLRRHDGNVSRRKGTALVSALEKLRDQHISFALAVSYLVLPPVAMLQFHAQQCVDLTTSAEDLHGDLRVLRVDTSVNCDSVAYQIFSVANLFLIVIYQSVPMVWFCLLWRHRRLLNPEGYAYSDCEIEDDLSVSSNSTRTSRSRSRSASNFSGGLRSSGSRLMNNLIEGLSQNNKQHASAEVMWSSSNKINKDQTNHSIPKGFDDNLAADESLQSVSEEREAEFAALEAARKQNNSLRHLTFLWGDYKPSAWYYEVVEVYRRMLFASALPVFAPQGLQREALGCILAILAIAIVREANSFQREATNVLLVLSQYQILLTFMAAFVVDSGTLDAANGSNDPFVLGIALCVVNAAILVVVALLLWARYRNELVQQKWRRPRTPAEVALLENLLGKGPGASLEPTGTSNELLPSSPSTYGFEMTSQNRDRSMSAQETAAQAVLTRHLLKASDVELLDRIGAGAFGEVFRGQCLGQPVAVKTMLDVTESNVRAFRAEILLTATLRHPNIVNFVGACWGEDLTCLLLEWVPKGSLQQLLKNQALDLRWGEPLLRLALDVSRGMAYLHGREFMDEADENRVKRCILHRDLKPDNVLVTEFVGAKLSDFGTSRAHGDGSEDVAMTAVGTPLFCAPEITRGEAYDASADVYSFGLLLLAMAIDEDLIYFMGERWRLSYGKHKRPGNPMRFIRAIAEEGWRPVVPPPLSQDPTELAEDIASLASYSDRLTNMEKHRLGMMRSALSKARSAPESSNTSTLLPNENADSNASSAAPAAVLGLHGAPPSIVRLLTACMLENPSTRPSFEECMHELESAVRIEVTSGDYRRTTHASSVAAAAAATAVVPESRLRGYSVPSKHQPAEEIPSAVSEVANAERSSSRDAHLLRTSQVFRSYNPTSHSHKQGTHSMSSGGTATANPCHQPDGAPVASTPALVETAEAASISKSDIANAQGGGDENRLQTFSDS